MTKLYDKTVHKIAAFTDRESCHANHFKSLGRNVLTAVEYNVSEMFWPRTNSIRNVLSPTFITICPTRIKSSLPGFYFFF